jgi:hypothetical protein
VAAAAAASTAARPPADAAAAAAAEVVAAGATQHAARLLPVQCAEMVPHVAGLLPRLLAGCAGRHWPGKESLPGAMAELVARTTSAFTVPTAALPTAPAPAGAPAGTPTSVDTPLRVLLAAASRPTAPLAYATACADGVALICRAYPLLDAYAAVADALAPVLARVGRPVPAVTAAAAGGDAGSPATAAGAGAAAAAPPRTAPTSGGPVVGGRVDENKEAEARAAAAGVEAERSALACACLTALAAALPPVLTRRVSGATAAAPASEAGSRSLTAALAPFVHALQGTPGVAAALPAAAAARLLVSPGALATHAAHAPALLRALTRRLAEAGGHVERASVLRAIGGVLAKVWLLPLPQPVGGGGEGGGGGAGAPPLLVSDAASDALAGVAAALRAEDRFSVVRVAGLDVVLGVLQRARGAGVAVVAAGQVAAAGAVAVGPPALQLAEATVSALHAALRKHADGADAHAAQVARCVLALQTLPAGGGRGA